MEERKSDITKLTCEKMLATIEKAAKESHPREDGDYIGEDGLLYCGKCKTPKEYRHYVEFLHSWRTNTILCACGKERYEAEKEADRKRQLEFRRADAFAMSEMGKWTFANDDMTNPTLTNAMQKYVENFADMKKSGKGLILWGKCGTGKTYAACEVANALIDGGYNVFVTSFSRIVNVLQESFEGRQKYINDLNRYHLIVIDDLGVERQTPYMQETVFNIIDSRYRAGLPMIITTNMDISELKKPQIASNNRIYDRILERCFPIEVNGASRRRKNIRDEYEDMKNMLGL